MKKFFVLIILSILLTSSFAMSTMASSAGDDSASAGGGGGGGGGPQFYDYYVPLVFGANHSDGISEVVVRTLYPVVVITTFAQNEFGSNVAQYQTPTKLVFNPEDNRGLTNGSLIRITSPSQVTGQRTTEDIEEDNSFAYSILPRRMMGFEYYAPFDGTISVFSLNAQTDVRVQDKDGTVRTGVTSPLDPLTLRVTKGAYINSSFPIIGAFYTDQEGTSASLAVPRYLQGSTYFFDGDVTAPRADEVDLSYITINPEQPTPLTVIYEDGTTTSINIFGETRLALEDNIRGVSVARGSAEVNLRVKYAYGGNIRSSTVQLMAIDEMRAGEFFLMPEGYSTHISIAEQETEFNFSRFDYDNGSYVAVSREKEIGYSGNAFSVSSAYPTEFIIASEHLFSMSISPGKVSHPMAPSVAFVNLPLNTATQKNITGLEGTWYRFANLAITKVEIIPGPVEEYTGQLIQIEVTANGTLPASRFSLEITIDEEIVIEETYDFLQVNETLTFNIRRFLPIGKDTLNITVDVDVDDEVNEISEEDNFISRGYNVRNNIRLRVSIFVIFLAFFGYGGYRVRKWLKQRKRVNRAHVDAILTFEEEQ